MWGTLLSKLKTDCHIPVALLIFAATTTFHFWTHLDLGSQYCNSLYALYAFLGGHAFVNRPQPPDNPDQK